MECCGNTKKGHVRILITGEEDYWERVRIMIEYPQEAKKRMGGLHHFVKHVHIKGMT